MSIMNSLDVKRLLSDLYHDSRLKELKFVKWRCLNLSFICQCLLWKFLQSLWSNLIYI